MDEGKKQKVRRIYAWIGIILFLLLIVNIFTIQFEITVSLGLYTFAIMFYLFFLRKKKEDEKDTENNDKKSE